MLILVAQEYALPALTTFLVDPDTLRSKLATGSSQLSALQGVFNRNALSTGLTATADSEQLSLLSALPDGCSSGSSTVCTSNQVLFFVCFFLVFVCVCVSLSFPRTHTPCVRSWATRLLSRMC